TVYPGASANLIQGFITTPIEQAVASAEGVDYITSSSVQGTSTIQVYVKLNFDPNQALTEVLAKVNSVKYLIPKESNDPIVTKTNAKTTSAPPPVTPRATSSSRTFRPTPTCGISSSSRR